MKLKIRQRRQRTVEQLESYIRPEWENISLLQVQQLLSSVVYRVLLKAERTLHSGKHSPVPTFLRHVAAIKFKMSQDFSLNGLNI